MFLVNNDKPQIRKGGKKSGPGADHNLDLPLFCPLELIIFFPLGQPGIHKRHPAPKAIGKTQHRLIGQSYLRDQKDHLPAQSGDMADQFHVNLGLSASGNAVKKICLPDSLVILADDPVCRRLLLFI